MNKIFVNCPVCDSKESIDFEVREMMFGKRVKYYYSHCKICDTVYLNDTKVGLDDLYPSNYYSFRSKSIGLFDRFRSFMYYLSIMGSIGKFSFLSGFFSKLFNDKSAQAVRGVIESSNNILDIGCGNGELIFTLSKFFKRKSFIGVDPFVNNNKVLSDNCRILKQEITDKFPYKFDLIMMNHSLEHMDNPENILKIISELLLPGGVIVIRIPVCDSYFFKKYFNNWVQLDAPRHRFIFSNNSFKILLERANLLLLSSVSDSRSFSYISSEMFTNDISLVDKNSFYSGRLRNFFKLGYWRNYLIANRIVKRYNSMNWGDQRVFIISQK